MTVFENRSSQGWAKRRYWSVGMEPPRLEDGSVDVRALCRMYDDLVNEGLPSWTEHREAS